MLRAGTSRFTELEASATRYCHSGGPQPRPRIIRTCAAVQQLGMWRGGGGSVHIYRKNPQSKNWLLGLLFLMNQ